MHLSVQAPPTSVCLPRQPSEAEGGSPLAVVTPFWVLCALPIDYPE